jgi:DMSO/TMAO reductase YedYZ molybdopterin-dependent catalytic subunit
MTPFISRGFRGRRRDDDPEGRVPPGQLPDGRLPVSLGRATPHTPLEDGTFEIRGGSEPLRWTWDELRALPSETVTVDIHCVTKWSKLDTSGKACPVDTLMERAGSDHAYRSRSATAGTRRTSRSRTSRTGRRGRVRYDGEPLEPEHGGPARLLVPHLYFWKSAKWVRGLRAAATTSPASGSRTATTLYGDRGRNSGTGATDLAGRRGRRRSAETPRVRTIALASPAGRATVPVSTSTSA